MSVLLFYSNVVPQTTFNLTFMDATGTNPLPAGQLVTLSRPGTATQSAYSNIGGTANFALTNSTILSPVFTTATASLTGTALATWGVPPPAGSLVIFAVCTGTPNPTAPSVVTKLDQIAVPSMGRYLTTYTWVANGTKLFFGFSDTTDTQVVAAYVQGWGPIGASSIDQHAITYVSGVTNSFMSPVVQPVSNFGTTISFFTYPVSGGTFTDGGGFSSGGSTTGTVEQLVGNYYNFGTESTITDIGSISGVTSYAAATIAIAPMASAYTASFYGTWSPPVNVPILNTQTDQTINIPTYQSPTLSQTGFTQSQANRWIRGAFGNTARQPGGIAYNLAWGLSWSLSQLSNQIQTTFQAMRLPTSVGSQIDSWAEDFFGNNLPREIGETDAAYIARIQTNLSAQGSLVSGISGVSSLYGATTITEPWRGDLCGGIDLPTAACDGTYGCVSNPAPDLGVYITPANPPFSQTAGAQARSSVMTKKPAGIKMTVYGISTQQEGYGVGRYGEARYGVSSESIATPL